MAVPGEGIDRRVLRGQRNREAIIDALIDLVEEGHLSPTADQIAERAGVARRSLYHHFSDLDSIALAVSERHWERLARGLRRIPSDSPFEERLDAFVAQRSRLFDDAMPMYQASLRTMHEQPIVAERVDYGHSLLRKETAATFRTELRGAATWKLEASDAVSGFDYWLRLRVNQKLSRLRAARVMRNSLRAVLFAN